MEAPALESTKRHTLNLSEHVAKPEKDLDAVRRAVATPPGTAGSSYDFGKRTPGTSAILAARVDSAVSEIDVGLAELRIALEFLDLTTHGEGARAVADAEKALGRVWRVVDEVWKECARAVRREDASSRAAG